MAGAWLEFGRRIWGGGHEECSLDHKKDQHIVLSPPVCVLIRGLGKDFVVLWSCMAFIGYCSGDTCWDALKGPSEVVGWRDTRLKFLLSRSSSIFSLLKAT